MDEPKELRRARESLAKAEARLDSSDGLHHLEEGLDLLEHVAASPSAGEHAGTARNLGGAYAAIVHARIAQQLDDGQNLPEPALTHWFAVIRSFDGKGFDVPPSSRELKIELVRRLIDIYYEGYSAEDKQKAYEALAKATGA